METEFSVSKPANIFHLIDNLTGWDELSNQSELHSRIYVSKMYESRFGITDEDRIFFSQYALIRSRTGFRGLSSAFIPAKNTRQAFSNAKKILHPFEFGILMEVFDHFRQNAELMYNDARPHLLRRKVGIEGEYKRRRLKGLFDDVASFYESSGYPTTVTAHLLVNACDGQYGGGANVDPDNHVTLEPVYLGKESTDYLVLDICMLGHEIAHIIAKYSNEEKRKQALEMLGERGLNAVEQKIVMEAINDTLFPGGVLAVKYGLLRKPKIGEECEIVPENVCKRDYYNSFLDTLGRRLYRSTQTQLRRGKSVFEGNYLERAVDELISSRP